MAQLIKHRAAAVDTWQTLALAEGETPETVALPAGDILFPLAVWQARRNEIISCHKRIGLILQPDDRVEDVASDLEYFIVIAIHFPKFVDGRGYSSAALLRQRYHFQGELRAVGDVLHDQLFYLKRVGFDAFALKEGKDVNLAIASAFDTFAEPYQPASDLTDPLFRRQAA